MHPIEPFVIRDRQKIMLSPGKEQSVAERRGADEGSCSLETKGGDGSCHSFEYRMNKKKRGARVKGFTGKPGQNGRSNRDHPAQKLVRAAELASTSGSGYDLLAELPTQVEQLGIIIGLWRRRKGWSRTDLASRAGCKEEELIALETGILGGAELKRVLCQVSCAMGVEIDRELLPSDSQADK
jgi:hypothetical protein